MNPATVIWEWNGEYLIAHHPMMLLRDKRFELPLTFRWDWNYGGWFWVKSKPCFRPLTEWAQEILELPGNGEPRNFTAQIGRMDATFTVRTGNG